MLIDEGHTSLVKGKAEYYPHGMKTMTRTTKAASYYPSYFAQGADSDVLTVIDNLRAALHDGTFGNSIIEIGNTHCYGVPSPEGGLGRFKAVLAAKALVNRQYD